MHTKHFKVVGLLVVALLLATSITVMGQDTGEIPQVTIEATADGFALSGPIPEGAVTIAVQNNSEAPVEADFVRLNPGKTVEDLEAVLARLPEAVMDPEAFMNAVTDLLAVGAILPGLPLEPGMSAEITYRFHPGEYVLLNWPGDLPTETIPLTVDDVEGDGHPGPEADVELGLVDFAFNAPISVAAGPQVWHVRNLASQPHEVIIAGGPDVDMSVRELNQALLALLQGQPVEGGPEPSIFVPPLASGGEYWITWDLEPGAYVIVCSFPDIAGSFHPHAALGMRQTFIVTETE